jgi:CHAT domain-containing protein
MAQYRSRGAALVFVAVVAVMSSMAFPHVRAKLADHARRQSFEQLLTYASATTQSQAYFADVSTSNRASGAATIATQAAVSRFLDAWGNEKSPAATRGRGVAELVQGRIDGAVAQFEAASNEAPNDAGAWNDLAAARLQRAIARDRVMELPGALAAADRALRLNPGFAPARFNRAAIIEALGDRHEAARAWRSFLEVNPPSDWSDVALRRLSLLNKPTGRMRWAAVRDRLATMPEAEIAATTREFPQMARGWAEVEILGRWANAHLGDDAAMATRNLGIARVTGQTLAETSGERLLAEAVARIDGASATETDLLAHAHVSYQKGRLAAHAGAFTEALGSFRDAGGEFARLGSPMERLCRLSQAKALSALNRGDDALQMLQDLQQDEVGAESRHRSLFAEIQRYIGLGEGLRGRWSVALDALTRASVEYDHLGERENLGSVQAVLGECHDVLGRPHEGWRLRVAASRLLAEEGSARSLHVASAGGTFAAIAAQEWETARSLAVLDQASALESGDTELIARASLRQAITSFHLGDGAAGLEALGSGRSRARQILERDAALRTNADLDVAQALITRMTAPRDALRLLDDAIQTHEQAGLDLYLPQLHLERGRIHLQLGDEPAAASDFDAGMNALLGQRATIPSPELRAGIFDNVSALFDEALRLALRNGDTERAFDIAERSRARALLDEIAAREAPFKRTTAKELRASLGDATFIEFAVLPEKVVAFVCTRTAFRTYEIAVAADELERHVDTLTTLVTSRKPVDKIQAVASSLFERVLAPAAPRPDTPLIVSADGPLQRVPWTALYNAATHRYVVEDHSLLLAPSAAVFVARSAARTEPPRNVLLIGNPEVDEEHFPDLRPLAGGDAEVRRIKQLYRRPEMWLSGEATRSRFLTNAPRYDVIHFAGHSIPGLDSGEDSFLLFAPQNGASAVYTADVAAMKFTNTRLVILAACSSLRGPTRGKEGMPSIARAFLAAGVQSVAGTLWDVEDEASEGFFTTLHQYLATGITPENALREAQLDMIRGADPSRAHPIVWAGVQVMGGSQNPPRTP